MAVFTYAYPQRCSYYYTCTYGLIRFIVDLHCLGVRYDCVRHDFSISRFQRLYYSLFFPSSFVYEIVDLDTLEVRRKVRTVLYYEPLVWGKVNPRACLFFMPNKMSARADDVGISCLCYPCGTLLPTMSPRVPVLHYYII